MPRTVTGSDGQIFEFPDDASDKEISSFLGAIPKANAGESPKAKTWTDTAIEWLPKAGAAVGGVAGTVAAGPFGGVGGAALGGAAGEAAKQLAERFVQGKPESELPGPMEAAGRMMTTGTKEGATAAAIAGASQIPRILGESKPIVAEVLQKGGRFIAQPHSTKKLVGRAIEAAGRAIDTEATAAPKITITADEFRRIQQLVRDRGMSEANAVSLVKFATNHMKNAIDAARRAAQ